MLRLLLRLWFTLLLFFLGRLLRPRTPRQGGPSSPLPRAPKPVPPIDRSDVVDVPFTEIPPPNDPAHGAAGGP